MQPNTYAMYIPCHPNPNPHTFTKDNDNNNLRKAIIIFDRDTHAY